MPALIKLREAASPKARSIELTLAPLSACWGLWLLTLPTAMDNSGWAVVRWYAPQQGIGLVALTLGLTQIIGVATGNTHVRSVAALASFAFWSIVSGGLWAAQHSNTGSIMYGWVAALQAKAFWGIDGVSPDSGL